MLLHSGQTRYSSRLDSLSLFTSSRQSYLVVALIAFLLNCFKDFLLRFYRFVFSFLSHQSCINTICWKMTKNEEQRRFFQFRDHPFFRRQSYKRNYGLMYDEISLKSLDVTYIHFYFGYKINPLWNNTLSRDLR